MPEVPTVGNPFSYIWRLGYHRLCPVIPPDAPLHPQSRIHKRAQLGPGKDPRGKAPGVRGSDGLWTGFNFVKHESTEADLEAWAAMGAGVGIKLGHGLLALDIDTKDKPTAIDLYQLAERMLGTAPIRFGCKPKSLLLYRITEDIPYDQVRFSTPTEESALVEVLGEGRQFVAHGIHPGTQKPYKWRTGLPRLDELPLTTPEQVEAYMATVAATMPSATRQRAHQEDRGLVPQERLRAAPDLVRSAVAALPNTSDLYPSRQDYVRMGYAIKAAMGPDHEAEALDLWLQWCGRWDGGHNDVDEAEEDWARMQPPFSVGAHYLFDQAEAAGAWDGRARSFFAPVAEPAPDRPAGLCRLLDYAAIMALPDPEFLIDRHIPRGSLGFLYGRPGCGKSFLALDMALTLAWGLPDWHGDALRPRPGAHVLYLAAEGVSGMKQRLKAWGHGRLVPDGFLYPRFSLVPETINFMKPEDVERMVETVDAAALAPLDFVVVDTVSRSLPGADENLQKDMTLFVRACEAVQRRFGAAVLGLHHTAKAGGMRGSSVLAGAGDFLLHLERKPEARVGRLTCDKQKDAPDGWSEAYAFSEVRFGGGERDVSLVPVRISLGGGEGEAGAARDVGPELVRDVLAVIAAAWDSGEPWSAAHQARERSGVRRLVSDFGMAAGAAEELLSWLEKTGQIVTETRDAKRRRAGFKVVTAGQDVTEENGENGVFD